MLNFRMLETSFLKMILNGTFAYLLLLILALLGHIIDQRVLITPDPDEKA